MTIKMKNESEFIFDEVLTTGFTVVPNAILMDERLTHNAIGLYVRIIRSKNVAGWKVYQSTFVNEKNGRTKIMAAMKELIDCGYIVKTKLRDEKGRMKGVSYKVYSTPVTPIPPKSEKPTSEKPTSDNMPLINKDYKNKDYKNKDIISSSTEDEDREEVELKSLMKQCQQANVKLQKKTVKSLLNAYGYSKVTKAIALIEGREGIESPTAYIKTVLKDMEQVKQVTPGAAAGTTGKDLKFTNYSQRDYDYDSLEKQLLGWDQE